MQVLFQHQATSPLDGGTDQGNPVFLRHKLNLSHVKAIDSGTTAAIWRSVKLHSQISVFAIAKIELIDRKL